MSQTPQLSNLPTELLLHVAGALSSRDLSSFSRLSRQFHWRFFHLLFGSAIAKSSDSKQLEQCLVSLFFHAAKHDSINLAQFLIYSTCRINLNGSIQTALLCSTEQHTKRKVARKNTGVWQSPLSCLPPDFTFLHLALLADAPKVAAALVKNGADISQEMEDYPDLMPLYLALPRSLSSSPKELDLALRIACSYALPKTAAFLLTRGANANTPNRYGNAAIHNAVMRRHPWREFPIVDFLLSVQCREDVSRWESRLLQTVSTLLDFGAAVDLQTRTLRTHECDPKCWRSIDCDRRGQTALHLASATGILAIVSRLLDAGANPNLPDGQGYTALYAALVQGHKHVACHILKVCDDPLNPIVCIREQTTALHVACRFSFPEMVGELLIRGADANVVDSHGRTPLHDVLAWARLHREEEAILTLICLAKFGADPHTTASRQTPRQLAATHASRRVRDMFWTLWHIRRTKRNLSTRHLNLPVDVRTDVGEVWDDVDDLTLLDPGSSDIGRSRRGAGGSKLHQDPFPRLDHPGKDLAKAKITEPIGRVASAAGTWSETKTARLIKGLETQAPPPNRALQLQKPADAFPTICEPDRVGAKAVVPGMLNAPAAQFWGGLTERIGSAVEETGLDSSGNTEEPRAEIGGRKNKRRWTPLRF